MRILFRFIALFTLMISYAYAEDNANSSKNHIDSNSVQQKENKARFKISERRILVKPRPSEESVSNFSMEELRVGAQRVLDKAEVQYYKSQCRYAFMSDRDVIENRCEAKKVSITK